MADPVVPDTPAVSGAETTDPKPVASDQGTWRTIVPKHLADEYRETLSGFESSEDFFKSGLESIQTREQYDGRTLVPGDGATTEEWNAYYKAIGRPEEASGYGVDNDEVSSIYMKANLSKEQADILNKGFVEMSQANDQRSAAEVAEAKEAEFKKTMGQLKEKYGSELDAKMRTAQTAVLNLGGPELSALLQKKGLDNDPEMVGFFISLGELMQEGHVPAGSRKAPESKGLTGMYESMKGL